MYRYIEKGGADINAVVTMLFCIINVLFYFVNSFVTSLKPLSIRLEDGNTIEKSCFTSFHIFFFRVDIFQKTWLLSLNNLIGSFSIATGMSFFVKSERVELINNFQFVISVNLVTIDNIL